MVKFVANMEAVSLWQSAQLQMKLPMKAGPWVGWWVGVRVEGVEEGMRGWGLTNESCTAPQKQVAVASSSLDQPSLAKPARGK